MIEEVVGAEMQGSEMPGAGMSDFLTSAGLVGDVVGFGLGEHNRKQARKARKKALQEWQRRTNDLGYRREATYRAQRGRINAAIGEFYKKKGWELPEPQHPGAYTARPLPGDAPLYPEDTFTYPQAEDSDATEAQNIVAGMPEMEEEGAVDTSDQEAGVEAPEDVVGDLAPEAPDVNVVDEERRDRAAYTAPAAVGAQPGGDITTPEMEMAESRSPEARRVDVSPQEYEALQLLRRRRY